MNAMVVLASLSCVLAVPQARAQNGAVMADVIRQMRATADRMEGQLPAEEIAEMRRSADELEREDRKGAFEAPRARIDPRDVAGRIAAEHGGKVDWLDQLPACVGYGWENYRTFHLKSGDRDAERDNLCRRAFGHLADYRSKQRSGDFAGSRLSLDAYDKAAHAAVDFFEKAARGEDH